MSTTALALNSSPAARSVAAERVAAGKPFSNTSGTFRGVTSSEGGGRLPYAYLDSVGRADYLIYSYDTPIAWRVGGQWVFPSNLKFSPTTSKHQTFTAAIIRYATI